MTAPLVLAAMMAGGACLPVEGEWIAADDLARADRAFLALPAEIRLGYAPAPGARRIFRVGQLRRLAARHGLAFEPGKEICFERIVEPLTQGRLLEAMESSLGIPGSTVEVLEFSRYPAPRGEMEFPLSGLTKPPSDQPRAAVVWKGFVRYAAKRRFRIWAQVRISAPARRVVATANLRAGEPIQAEQLRVETYDGFPGERSTAGTLEQVVGRLPRRSIATGSPVRPSLLEEPKDVERGETVRVEVRAGSARIEFDGRAESAGRIGEAILVRNPDSGRKFQARVEDRGRVVVNSLAAEGGK